MSSQPAGQLVGELVGAYKLVRVLGEGGMGTVYEGLHPTLGRRAAIKVLHLEHSQNAEILLRFFNEARAVNIVEHPSLVNIYEYGTTPAGVAYIVMEFLAGESLRSRQRRIGGRMGLAAVPIARQIANALAATHEKQIVHRDLKPDNVMLVPDTELPEGERAKILDFGIAKLAGDGGAEALKVKTKTGAMLGTPTYMSPEQCRGLGTIDGRTDVYALGVILFELLAGQPPFVSDGFGDLIGMHMFKAAPELGPLAPKTAGAAETGRADARQRAGGATEYGGDCCRPDADWSQRLAAYSQLPTGAGSNNWYRARYYGNLRGVDNGLYDIGAFEVR